MQDCVDSAGLIRAECSCVTGEGEAIGCPQWTCTAWRRWCGSLTSVCPGNCGRPASMGRQAFHSAMRTRSTSRVHLSTVDGSRGGGSTLVRTCSHVAVVVLSLLSLLLMVPAASAAFPVELTVQNGNATNWSNLPVTSGVPFLRGQVKSVSRTVAARRQRQTRCRSSSSRS